MGPRMSESTGDAPDLESGRLGRDDVKGAADAPESVAHLPSVPIVLKV